MKWMLIVFSVAVLGLSGFAGWFFFGGPEDDPTRRRTNAHIARIEAKVAGAEAGNIKAQYELARLYHNADHIEPDLKAAFRWYSKAAEKGHAGAQYFIGAMYAKGEAVRQDYFRASEWYRLAANLGRNADAQLALGELYFKGLGVANGYAEALAWYKLAALGGHPVAQHLLAAMYVDGYADGLDAVEAYTWFTLALPRREQVMTYDPKLDPRLDPLAARDKLAKRMNQNQIKRAREAAANFRPRR